MKDEKMSKSINKQIICPIPFTKKNVDKLLKKIKKDISDKKNLTVEEIKNLPQKRAMTSDRKEFQKLSDEKLKKLEKEINKWYR